MFGGKFFVPKDTSSPAVELDGKVGVGSPLAVLERSTVVYDEEGEEGDDHFPSTSSDSSVT